MEIYSPITGKSGVTQLFKLNLNNLKKGYLRELGIDISHLFENCDEIALYRCTKTGYEFFYPPIKGDNRFYQDLQKFDWYYSENRWDFDIVLEIINGGDLLEIGCGEGHFLEKVQIKGINCFGLDLNSNAIQHCLQNDLRVANKNLSEIRKTDSGKYESIVAFQLLEHLNDVSSFFRDCEALLKKNGKLFISVPNNRSYVFKSKRSAIYENISLLLNLPPHHIGHWQKNSLQRTAKYFGYKTHSIIYQPIYSSTIQLIANNIVDTFCFVGFMRKKLYKIVLNIVAKYPNRFRGNSIIIILEKNA